MRNKRLTTTTTTRKPHRVAGSILARMREIEAMIASRDR
jgi:hypothetical protein